MALLALLVFASLGASRHRGPVFDELAHLVAGASYVEHGDYRLHPENGLLPQTLFGVALRGDGAEPPPAHGEVWRRSDMWTAGRTFVFGQRAPWQEMVLRARAVVVFLSVLLAASVWWVARRLWGPAGGLTALALYTLSPDILAHSATATSDLCAALFFFWATVALGRLFASPGLKTACWAAAALVGLTLSKASAVLMAPVALVMLGVRAVRGQRPEPRLVGALVVTLALLVAGVWAGYGFRYSTFSPDDPAVVDAEFAKPLAPMLARTGALRHPIGFAMDHELLPEAWLYGFTFVLAHSEARPAFLRGDHRSDGWWWFFPYVVLVKTPLAALAVLVLALGLAVHDRGRWSVRSDPDGLLIVPLCSFWAVYWAISLTSNLNIGSRHLLPVLAPTFVLAGSAGRALSTGRGRVVGAALLAALLIEVGVAYPRFLSYFNRLDGGPSEAWRNVVDSSLDWGQDGPALAAELDRLSQPNEPAFLAWFGSSDPREFGIEAHALPSFMGWQAGPPRPLRPGLYAISATQLQGVYLPEPGPWTAQHEQRYQAGRAVYRAWLLEGVDPGAGALEAYGVLRFQRLCAWLRSEAEPVGRAGWSVLVFRLSAQDLKRALGEAPPG